MTESNGDKSLRMLRYMLVSVALMFVVFGTYGQSKADPANSRLATVYALTQYGTFYIDHPVSEPPNPFEQRTIDKVMVKGERIGDAVHNGRLISSKPPVLPLLMTAEYVVMNSVFGLEVTDDEDRVKILYWMALTLVGFSYVLALVFFTKTVGYYVDDELTKLVMLAALAFGTQLWGFSIMLNNHVPAAGMLMVAAYFGLGLGGKKLDPTPLRFVLFGLAGGLVATFDIPGTIFVLFLGLYVLRAYPRQALTWTVGAAALPLGVHVAVMVAVTGSPLPVQMRGETYHFEGAYWRHPRQIDALNEPKLTYLFHMTLGRCGLFSLYPITLIGVAGFVRACMRKDMPGRGAILAAALGFLILSTYYVTRTNNYAGEAYGFRWYIVSMPVLLLMGAPLMARIRRQWQWIFVALMLGVSCYSAWECTKGGWGSNREWTVRFLGRSYERPG
jgi:hypothetical protein